MRNKGIIQTGAHGLAGKRGRGFLGNGSSGMEVIMSSEKLNKARVYERKGALKVPEEQRPAFHLSVPTGWMNDPNGFSFYKGE